MLEANHPEPASHTPQVGAWDLFLAFTHITLISFGGVLFWTRRLIVERKRWLTEREFVEIVALSQLLPGVNGINMTVMLGYRFAGWAGAAGALAGFLTAPCLVVTAMGILHQRYGELPLVQQALTGMSAVAVGLLIATGAKVAVVIEHRWRPWLFVTLTFLGVGVMRWPLLAVLLALAPCSIAWAWKGKH
jgi:chromate transporter